MTQLLEQALAALNKLPAQEQDAIASMILEELADEQRWDDSFARSQDKLAEMEKKVRADIQAGRTETLHIDEL